MASQFKKLKSCKACTGAGWGWCPIKRMCGGFANKQCSGGENDHSPDSLVGAGKKKPARATPPASGDMSKEFAKYTTCPMCVGAGWGWCPIRKMCGGFANNDCGDGEDHKPKKDARKMATGRGKKKKKSKKKKSVAEAAAAAGANAGAAVADGPFAKYKSCSACVDAGWGWDTETRSCGRHSNRQCAGGDADEAADDDDDDDDDAELRERFNICGNIRFKFESMVSFINCKCSFVSVTTISIPGQFTFTSLLLFT